MPFPPDYKRAIDQYWHTYLRVTPDSDRYLVASGAENGLLVLTTPDAVIVRTHPDWLPLATAALRADTPDELAALRFIEQIGAQRPLVDSYGPGRVYYCHPTHFIPDSTPAVLIDPARHAAALETFWQAMGWRTDPTYADEQFADWPAAAAVWQGDQIVALTRVRVYTGTLGTVLTGSLPAFRGKRLGGQTLSTATGWLHQQGLIAQADADYRNKSSLAMIEHLGYQLYGYLTFAYYQ